MRQSRRHDDSRKQTVKILRKNFIYAFVLLAIALAVMPKAAFAQTDEIQVYDAEIEELVTELLKKK